MIYAPPELAKHLAAVERLRQNDTNPSTAPAGARVLALNASTGVPTI